MPLVVSGPLMVWPSRSLRGGCDEGIPASRRYRFPGCCGSSPWAARAFHFFPCSPSAWSRSADRYPRAHAQLPIVKVESPKRLDAPRFPHRRRRGDGGSSSRWWKFRPGRSCLGGFPYSGSSSCTLARRAGDAGERPPASCVWSPRRMADVEKSVPSLHAENPILVPVLPSDT